MNETLRTLLQLPLALSDIAGQIDQLHLFVLLTTVIGAGLVTVVTIYFLVTYRARSEFSTTRVVKASRKLELGVAGVLVALFVTWWIIGFRQYVDIQSPPKNALTIHVTGKQWMWKFSYLDGTSSLGYLVVPQGKPVRLVLTSRDVVHSYFVPALRLKADAVPYRYTQLWFQANSPGVFPAYCAEYCGLSHARMLSRVVVLTPREYRNYRAGERVEMVERARRELSEKGLRLEQARENRRAPSAGGLSALGKNYAQKYACSTCHDTDDSHDSGSGRPKVGPSWVGLFGTKRLFTDGTSRIADENYLRTSIVNPMESVVVGFSPTMPTYQGQMSFKEQTAIISYIRSLGVHRNQEGAENEP